VTLRSDFYSLVGQAIVLPWPVISTVSATVKERSRDSPLRLLLSCGTGHRSAVACHIYRFCDGQGAVT